MQGSRFSKAYFIGAWFLGFVCAANLVRAQERERFELQGGLPVAKKPANAEPLRTPIIIAHRGASGYLPEHTLAAKAYAHAQGADYLEQDCVMTKDDEVIVLHDVHIDTVTDVAKKFPTRAREDGRYYAIDFTLEEIKSLHAYERFDPSTQKAVYPKRFPAMQGDFRIPTLEEEVAFIQGLNRSTGHKVGVYVEIKKPAWHQKQGKDISSKVLAILKKQGYDSKESKCFVQCFDAKESRRIHSELGSQLKLVQLIGENSWKESETDYDAMRTANGLKEVAEYADAIGPSLLQIARKGEGGEVSITDLVPVAHAAGLEVHPYTARADELPPFAKSFDELIEIVFERARVDGLFTDFPDLALKHFGKPARSPRVVLPDFEHVEPPRVLPPAPAPGIPPQPNGPRPGPDPAGPPEGDPF